MDAIRPPEAVISYSLSHPIRPFLLINYSRVIFPYVTVIIFARVLRHAPKISLLAGISGSL